MPAFIAYKCRLQYQHEIRKTDYQTMCLATSAATAVVAQSVNCPGLRTLKRGATELT